MKTYATFLREFGLFWRERGKSGYSSAAKKRFIRCVDNCINILKHDAIVMDFDSHALLLFMV